MCRIWVVSFDVSYVFPISDSNKWPIYEYFHVLHFNLYDPLPLFMSCGSLLCKLLYNVLVDQKAVCKLVCLNKLVTFCIRGQLYVKVIHFFFCCVGMHVVLVCGILSFKLQISCNEKPLLLAMDRIMFISCCLHCSVIGKVTILFM
jgi:hypothetical protein